MPSGVERAFSEAPSANVREHAWGDGSGVRCAGACSGKVRVVEAAAQVSSLRLMARLMLPVQLVFWPLPLPLPLPLPAPFSLLPVRLVMRRSMKEGRAAAAPARKATGAKSAHWRIPHPPMATGRDMRSLTMPVFPSSSMAPPAPPCYPGCPRESRDLRHVP